ncbi:hypothetical protein NX059_005737 [Plenodomus lindquistii]|nr:hypothetical protein NX059_005737 [Plenodomus lindquistii]
MACCILTAFVMNRLIKVCDTFDFQFLQIKYNDDEESDACAPAMMEEKTTSKTCRVSIGGMTCGACTASVMKHLEDLDGVFRANVSLALGRATVSYTPAITTPGQMVRVIQDAGYEADLERKSVEETIERLRQSHELRDLKSAISSASVWATLLVGLQYLPSWLLPIIPYSTETPILAWLSLVLACRVQIWDATTIHSRAWRKGSRHKATMDTLLSLSLLLGLSLSAFQILFGDIQEMYAHIASGSFLTIVILAGRYLEAVLKRESNSNLAALYELQTEAELYRLTGSDISVPASLLNKGDDVILKPQATVPCDCYILEGRSAVNESTITGETLPVVKAVGDFLLAGTKNLSYQLRVIISQDQSESSLARVIEGVSTATEQRLHGAEPLDALMNYFVSAVLALAGVSFVLILSRNRALPLAESFALACERATTILAAACPCGIGLATPSAAMAGIDVAYSQGILLGGGIQTMQALRNATHVVMDKTGTLTRGHIEVVHCEFNSELRLNRHLCYRLLAAAEAEEARVHPVAKAVFKWALVGSHANSTGKTSVVAETRSLKRVLGKGVSCEVKGYADEWIAVHIGQRRYLEESGIRIRESRSSMSVSGSMVYFAFDGQYGGGIEVQDAVREEALSVVSTFLSEGLEVSMLTGDSAAEASLISARLGIPVLGSRALPSDKMEHIRDLQRRGHHVVMVGDGVNDSLAQAAADVGISISLTQGCLAGAGSVIIASGNLRALESLLTISKRVVAQAKLNVSWTCVYNLVAVSMAMGLWEGLGIRITA